MTILGIDPGTRFCGYGIIQANQRRIIAGGCDVINLNQKDLLSSKLDQLYKALSEILSEYHPDVAVVETVFYGKNIKSAITLAHARGVILMACAINNIPLYEYSPREIKKAVTGNGNASKVQVRNMIQKVIGLKNNISSEDASDGLAIAYTHFNKIKFGNSSLVNLSYTKET